MKASINTVARGSAHIRLHACPVAEAKMRTSPLRSYPPKIQTLSSDWVRQVELIDKQHSGLDVTWFDRYRALTEYFDVNGHSDVEPGWSGDSPFCADLSKWASIMRDFQKNGQHPPVVISELLNQVDFGWNEVEASSSPNCSLTPVVEKNPTIRETTGGAAKPSTRCVCCRSKRCKAACSKSMCSLCCELDGSPCKHHHSDVRGIKLRQETEREAVFVCEKCGKSIAVPANSTLRSFRRVHTSSCAMLELRQPPSATPKRSSTSTARSERNARIGRTPLKCQRGTKNWVPRLNTSLTWSSAPKSNEAATVHGSSPTQRTKRKAGSAAKENIKRFKRKKDVLAAGDVLVVRVEPDEPDYFWLCKVIDPEEQVKCGRPNISIRWFDILDKRKKIIGRTWT